MKTATKTKAVVINDWGLVFVFDPDIDDADVIKAVLLAGHVMRHPDLCPKGIKHGFDVETSMIERVEGPIVTTLHTIYQLSKPSRGYLSLLTSRGLTFNPTSPIPPCFSPDTQFGRKVA